MISKFISIFVVSAVLLSKTFIAYSMEPVVPLEKEVLASKTYSLSDRYSNSYVNNVFSDNILLTLAYMRGSQKSGDKVDWSQVKDDFNYTLVIKPGQTFAFHDALLLQYQNTNIETSPAHFDSTQGYESDGWLVGDGVCHLASFMNVVAREANLQVVSPTPHNFAVIPDVPRQYGVAIYYSPDSLGSSALQNLYITNTFNKPIIFIFTHKGSNLSLQVEKLG